MRRYANSKFRLILLAAMLIAAGVVAGTTFGQTPAAPAAADAPHAAGLFQMIISHWLDPVFITIFVLSITGLTLIIQGFIKNRASVLLPDQTIALMRDMIATRRFKDLLDFTETDPSFMSKALNPALKRAPIFSNMKEAMETAIGEQTAEQFRRIEYLNIIGNLGPLLGLLGTVLGMIQAFSEMQASGGSASPAQLAGGISTALTHTFLGLALAVPCLAAFGVLRTMVDRLTVRGALICEDLLLMIRPAEPRPAQVQPAQQEMRAVPEPLMAPPGASIQMPTPPPPPSLSRKPTPSAYPQGGL
jgi:biopolymer transport protein ExbB